MNRGELGGDLTRLAAMHSRQYVIVFVGILTTLFCTFALFVPIVSTSYPYWERLDGRSTPIEVEPEQGTVLPASAAAALKSAAGPWDHDWFRVSGYWTPTADQVSALERELPVRLEAIRSYAGDSAINAIASRSRQYLGLVDFFTGSYILVIGYDPTVPRLDPAAPIRKMSDSAWSWSAHFDPRSGRFTELSLYRWH
jgi:hypothetical protein